MSSVLETLQTFAESFAQCPCCLEVRECYKDCTYREDTSESHEWHLMMRARAALKGEEYHE